MQGYTPTLALTALYLLAVYVGPRIMKNREPFKLQWALVVYNFVLVIINFHISSEVSFLFYSFHFYLKKQTKKKKRDLKLIDQCKNFFFRCDTDFQYCMRRLVACDHHNSLECVLQSVYHQSLAIPSQYGVI
jgi:hypothetical protein